MDYIKAAGGIVCRDGTEGTEIVLVHRPRYDDWSLPKGKLEPGESWKTAAVREVEEETQALVRIGEFVGPVLYQVNRTPKLSLFWMMDHLGDHPFVPNVEIDAIEWLTVKDAITRLDHVDEKELIRQSGLLA